MIIPVRFWLAMSGTLLFFAATTAAGGLYGDAWLLGASGLGCGASGALKRRIYDRYDTPEAEARYSIWSLVAPVVGLTIGLAGLGIFGG